MRYKIILFVAIAVALLSFRAITTQPQPSNPSTVKHTPEKGMGLAMEDRNQWN